MKKPKINDDQMALLKLIERSPLVDGWASVSHVIMPYIKKLPKELVVWKEFEDGKGQVHLSEEGMIVLKWI